MTFVSAIILTITVILVYYVLYQLYSALFRITGITKDKSRFQTISLLTNAGYTTTESEIITGDKTRRNIAKSAMLTGYFFSVVIVSLFINIFLSLDFTRIDSDLIVLFSGFGGLLAFFLLLQLPPVRKFIDDSIDKLTVRVFRSAAKENFISVLDTYGADAICKVFLYKVPALLEGKMVIDSDIRKKSNINILLYERKGKVRHVAGDTIFSDKDILLVFGPSESIREVFLLKDRSNKNAGEQKKDTNKTYNEVTIIENYDYQVLADIKLVKVPEFLKGKTLIESKIKDYFSINVMMVSRNGKPINLTKDTILKEDDKVIAFGPYQNIQTVFGEKENDSVKEEEMG